MPISNFQLPIEKKSFAQREKRWLTLRAERIDPARLIGGKAPAVEAEHERTERLPTHQARFFQLKIGIGKSKIAKVQLNHGNPADDEARLAAIAEDLLSPESEAPGEEAPGTAGGWSDKGGISPRIAGGL